MDRILADNLKRIALDIRHWIEDRAEQGENDVLAGWCAIASAELFRTLTSMGIDCEMHVAEIDDSGAVHCFLTVEDHVLDVTASQFKAFRKERVVMMHQREAEVHDFYRSDMVFDSVKSLIRYQNKTGWPQKQVAYRG